MRQSDNHNKRSSSQSRWHRRALAATALATAAILPSCSSSEPTKATIAGFDHTVETTYQEKAWKKKESKTKPKEVEGNLKITGSHQKQDGCKEIPDGSFWGNEGDSWDCFGTWCSTGDDSAWHCEPIYVKVYDYKERRWVEAADCGPKPRSSEIKPRDPRRDEDCEAGNDSRAESDTFYKKGGETEKWWLAMWSSDGEIRLVSANQERWRGARIGQTACIDMATEPVSFLKDEECAA